MPREKPTPKHRTILFSPEGKRIPESKDSQRNTSSTSTPSSNISNGSMSRSRKKSSSKKSAGSEKSRTVKRHFTKIRRFGQNEVIDTKTLRYIKYLQRTFNFLIPRLSFSRLVREILMEYTNRNSISMMQKQALEAIQEATEHYVVTLFGECCLVANHAKRKTITAKDMGLLLVLRGA